MIVIIPNPKAEKENNSMTKAIQQSVVFNASTKTLYEMYIDSKKHSMATGAQAKLGRKAGAAFTAFDGSIKGRNLLVVPGKMIVQAWRATHWKKTDPDSILVLTFNQTPSGTRLDLVHANVPEHDHKGVTEGWKKYYWNPWREHLAEGGR
jgi:activator of HSP90 ATPase